MKMASRIFHVDGEPLFPTCPHIDCICTFPFGTFNGSELQRLPEASPWRNCHRECCTLTEVPTGDSRLVTKFQDECLHSENTEFSSQEGPTL